MRTQDLAGAQSFFMFPSVFFLQLSPVLEFKMAHWFNTCRLREKLVIVSFFMFAGHPHVQPPIVQYIRN